MKKNFILILTLFIFGFLFLTPAFTQSDDFNFVIAPPPVGYPVFKAGSTDNSAGVTGIMLKIAGINLKGLGLFGIMQKTPSKFYSQNTSIGASAMVGDEYDLFMFQIPVGVNFVFNVLQNELLSLMPYAGFSTIFGLMTMEHEFFGDTLSTMTGMLNVMGKGGIQANISFSDFIASPFFEFSFSGGLSATEFRSSNELYDQDSTVEKQDIASSYLLGFDVLHVPTRIALSSMFKQKKDFSVFTITLRFKI